MLADVGDRTRPDARFGQNVATLARLLKAAENGAPRPSHERVERLSEDFLGFVGRHQLQLLANWLLTRRSAAPLVPDDAVRQIKALALTRWMAQENLVRELERLSRLLAAAGHEFILLKGAYLAERFFGGIDRRLFHDLDILVRSDEVRGVERVLTEAGYSRKSTVLINASVTSRFTHAFDFTSSKGTVDLHWLLSANAAHRLDYDAIWRERQEFQLRRHRYFVLSDEYQLVFVLISIFKDVERGAPGLKQFVDLFFILGGLERQLDWTVFFERRRRERILRIAVNILAFFLDLFDCSDRFPEISAALERHRRLVKRLSPAGRQALVEAAPGAVRNKLWAAGLYDCSRAHVIAWWLASLPFRLAVHDPGRYGRGGRASTA